MFFSATKTHTQDLEALLRGWLGTSPKDRGRPGRDYGDRLEVTRGLQEGDAIIPNPGDAAREGLKVDVAPAHK